MNELSRPDLEGMSDEVRRLRDVAKSVVEHAPRIRKLALPDQVAIALILDRREFLPDGEFTMLQAVEYLGEERVRIAIAVEKTLMLDFEDEQE